VLERNVNASWSCLKSEGVEASEGGQGGEDKALNNFNFMKVGITVGLKCGLQPFYCYESN